MTSRPSQSRPRGKKLPMFATCVPGLGRMLRHQLAEADGIDTTGGGFDGRTDIVFFDADQAGRAHALRSRLAEDVLAEVGRASRTLEAGPGAVARMAWQSGAVERALSLWADEVRQLSGSMTCRVSARVLTQTRPRPADLRRAMTEVIAADKPRWKFAGAAELDVRLSEWHDGQYVAGLRIGGAIGQRTGRPAEPSGPLPATVAAAMVQLAEPAAGRNGAASAGRILFDPCCGAGTILAEAAAAGWAAEGGDVDPVAVATASQLTAGASVQLGDACEVLLADDCVSACVSWLPGRVPGSWQDWAGAVLAELSRVTRSGGRVVLLAPDLPRAAIPPALRLRKQVPIQLLGTRQSIWVFHRA